ncbi:Acyl-protein synthetase, LuxE [Modestobacter sp. DSM 44400]|uniref:LuxE/PaaK family acyltransferase n=1 Tax=Modestobacter sp. DSM 44400 TaxID=1550230 RepID=UPI0008964A5A|nr:hypothetical protein [Modestobacter sp. DSM 44400]SDY57739.1 Acyl-protein synthetase, LuxE [Modestobacter sp. DSM 44400]
MTADPGAAATGLLRDELDLRLQALIERAPEPGGPDARAQDAEFGRLALELFAFQYEHNVSYRRFCRVRGAEPGRLGDWTQIPPVPLTAFKELPLAVQPPAEAAAVFLTSGSTDPARRGRNHHPHLHLYDASLRANFAASFLPDLDRIRLLVLNPPPATQPHSSIAYFFGRLVDFFGAPGSDFFVDDHGVQVSALTAALREAETAQVPVALLGTSFAYVHVLDALAQEGLAFQLPEGSRLLDTGGFKGRSREVSPEGLRAAFGERLGIPDARCTNYYGMTEISTQYYESGLGGAGPRPKTVPPWARVRIVDPVTRLPVPDGQPGLVVHYDLANRGSCLAVLSEDTGYLVPDGDPTSAGPRPFVLLGRASGSEARGCSIAVDEFLTAVRGAHR